MATKNPWLGLASYEEPKNDGTDYEFCGRDEETLEMVRVIDNNLFVTLYGSSGIGKTSLLRAGVIPILRRKDYFPLYVRLSQESKEISYAEAIIQKMTNSGLVIEKSANVIYPDSNDRLFLWEYFATTRFLNEGREVYPVIILDQFEEVFREGGKSKAELLLKQIYLLLNDELEMSAEDGWSSDTNYRFVASVREDFLFVLEDSIDENSLDLYKNNRYRLRPMKPEQARQVVLMPGKDCVEETEKDAVAERIISLSKRQQDNDIDTLMLSLVCAGTYEKKSGGKITLSDLAIWKNNPMEVYYKDAVKGLTANQIRYIQQRLIRDDGSRRRVEADEVIAVLGEDTYLQLTKGKNRLFAIGDKEQIELLHDQLGMAVYEERRAFEEQERKKKQRRRLLTIIVLSLLFAILGLGVGGYSLKQKRRAENALYVAEEATKEKENTIQQLEKAITDKENARQQAEKATEEKENTIKELGKKNIVLANLNFLLENEKENVRLANWGIKRNQARFVAEKANALANEDSYFARRLALSVLPNDLDAPNIPYVVEAEIALRNSSYNGMTKLYGHTMDVNSIEFSNDGKYLLSSSTDNTIKMWDSYTGKLLKSFDANNGPVDYASFSSDNKKIVSVSRNRIYVWDVDSEELIDTLSTTAKAVIFDERDENVIAINEKYVDIWNVSKRKRVSHRKYGIESFQDSWLFRDVSISVSCDKSKVYFTTRYGGDYIFDLQTGKREQHTDFSANCPFAHISILYDKESKHNYIVETETLNRIKELPSDLKKEAFSLKGDKLAATLEDNTIVLWETGIANIYTGHSDNVNTAVFSSDGKYILSSSKDSTICVWNKKTHEILNIMRNNGGYSDVAFYFPDDKAIVSASRDSNIYIWKPEKDGYSVRKLQRHQDMVWDVHISPNGRWILSTANDSSLIVGDASFEEGYYSIKLKDECVSCGAFRPDSKQFVVSVIGWILVFDTESGDLINSFPVHRKKVTGVTQSFAVRNICYSPNGEYILTSSSDKTAAIWKVSTGDCVLSFEGHTESVESANYSPDGKYVVTASSDGTIKVWRSDNAIEVASIKGHVKDVNYAAFSSDGLQIVSASDDRTIRVWPFPPLQQLIKDTRDRFKNRPLTPEERRMYYLE